MNIISYCYGSSVYTVCKQCVRTVQAVHCNIQASFLRTAASISTKNEHIWVRVYILFYVEIVYSVYSGIRPPDNMFIMKNVSSPVYANLSKGL